MFSRILSILAVLLLSLVLASPAARADLFDPLPGVGAFDAVPQLPGEIRLWDMATGANNTLLMVGQIDGDSEPWTDPLIVIRAPNGQAYPAGGVLVDGYWVPPMSPEGDAWLNSIRTVPDGSFLYCGGAVQGSAEGSWSRDAIIGRVGGNHQPDERFGGAGNNGIVRLARDDMRLECTSVEQLTDGRIAIVGGWRDRWAGGIYPGPEGWFLAILKPNGALDTSINGDGYVIGQGGTGTWDSRELNQIASGLIQNPQGELRFDVIHRADLWMRSMAHYTFNLETGLLMLPTGGKYSWSMGDIRSAAHLALTPHGGVRELSLATAIVPAPGLIVDPPVAVPVLHQHAPVDYPGNAIPFSFGVPAWPPNSDLPGGLAIQPQYGRSVIAVSRNFLQPRSHLFMHYRNVKHQPVAGANAGGTAGVEISTGLPLPPGSTEESLTARRVVIAWNGNIYVLVERKAMQNGIPRYPRPVVVALEGGESGPASADDWSLQLKPDVMQLSFPEKQARPNELVESSLGFVSGLPSGIWVPIAVHRGEMQINDGEWTTQPRYVKNGAWVRVRGRAWHTQGGLTDVMLRVGGVRGTSSWNSVGGVSSSFRINASLDPLPGVRCLGGPLNTGCGQNIPDIGSLTSAINVFYNNANECRYIRSVQVNTDITHSRIGDLRLTLKDPNGQTFLGGSEGYVKLLEHLPARGSTVPTTCTAANIAARFTEFIGATPLGDACGAVPGAPGLAGDVRPLEPLGSLVGRPGTGMNGGAVNGIWTLQIDDGYAGSTGKLNDWSIEVNCSFEAPLRADLEVTTSGPTEVIAGEPLDFDFVVRNNGPHASGPAAFSSYLPRSTASGIQLPSWACTASAGSTCTPAPAASCSGGICTGPRIDVDLDLAPNGTATISVDGEAGALIPHGVLLDVDGTASIHSFLGSASDPNPGNNTGAWNPTVYRHADFDVASLGARQTSATRILVSGSVLQHGPSAASGGVFMLFLPAGYTIEHWSCARAGLACAGAEGSTTISPNGQVLSITDVGGSSSSIVPWEVRAWASWSGAQAPAGEASLVVAPTANPLSSIDPDASNNARAILLPDALPNDVIFVHDFD